MPERGEELREEGLGYLAESRSFALSVVSILPLVLIYQLGIIRSGYAERNLAQAWLEGPLRLVGLGAAHLLNVALVVGLVAVLWRSGNSRSFSLVIVAAMIGEGAFYAALLYKGAPALAGVLDERAARLFFAVNLRANAPLCLALGAGVYEELLFRLALIGGGGLLLSKVFLWNRRVSVAVMLVISSLLFAAAHHVGPLGEPVESYSFLYRAVCGLVLGLVFLGRGLGVAVWTHSLYNALVMLYHTQGG